jgi:molecular chaperone GrpE
MTKDQSNKKTPPQPKAPKTNILEDAQRQAAENLQGWQRAVADYQNLQKETERRVGETIKYATEEFIKELLPMVDHFNYGLRGIPEAERDSGWVKGMEHIRTNFLKILENHGVQVIETVGKPFDPAVHEAVEEVPVPPAADAASAKSGTVAEEVAAGFTLNGKLIQPAKVKVFQ